MRVNDGFRTELCSLRYTYVEVVATAARSSMSNRLTACMVPVCLADRPRPPPPPPLGSASERYCLACARPPPPNLSHEADVLQWVMAERGVLPVDRGLDAASSPCRGLAGSSSPECEGNLARIPAVCDDLRVQLAADKLEGPSECLMFIGIDTKGVGRVRPRPDFAPITPRLLRWLRSIICKSSQMWRDAALGRSNDVFRGLFAPENSVFI